jgi:hypothetical protein
MSHICWTWIRMPGGARIVPEGPARRPTGVRRLKHVSRKWAPVSGKRHAKTETYSMSPESGHRFRVKDMRENKDLKRAERI